MPKKYLTAQDSHLLAQFGISYLETTISSRCDRIFCSCGNVFDNSNGDAVCDCAKNGKYPEGLKKAYQSMSPGRNIIKKDTSKILHEPFNDGRELFYYEELVAFVNSDDGTVSFNVSKVPVLFLSSTEYEIRAGYSYDALAVTLIEQAIKNSGIKNPEFDNVLNIAKMVDCSDRNSLAKLVSTIKDGAKLIADADFVAEHTECVKDYISRYHRNIQLEKVEDLCTRYEIPKCLVEFLKDPYFSTFVSGYADTRGLDIFPSAIKEMFKYYVSCKKMDKSSIARFLKYFTPEDFETLNNIDCLINFVRKNLYMGDNVFKNCKDAFEYLKDNGIPVSTDHLNWKYYCGSNGPNWAVPNFPKESPKATIEEFTFVRETQGIVAAAKRLLTEFKAQKEED